MLKRLGSRRELYGMTQVRGKEGNANQRQGQRKSKMISKF